MPPCPAPAKTLVLFVHGFSSSKKCWLPFFKLLRTDRRVRAGFVLKCFGYPTSWFSFSVLKRMPSIRDVARSLAAELDVQYGEYQSIILVGHSQGGLVIQAYLAEKLEGRAYELARIRELIFFATPNLGSMLLFNLRRILFFFLPNRQETELRVLNEVSADVRARVSQHIVSATVRGPNEWPIPVRCFYGLEDGIVEAASAQGAFVDPIALPGDHSGILKPRSRRDLRYSALVDALTDPPGHRGIFEIARYETRVTVEPAQGKLVTRSAKVPRELVLNNKAVIFQQVRFSAHNSCPRQYVLSWMTRNPDGYLEAQPSHANEAWPKELVAYEEARYFTFRFTPKPDETYSLTTTAYNGFNEGNQTVEFNLGNDFFCKVYYFKLDLSSFARAGYALQPPVFSFSERAIQCGVPMGRMDIALPSETSPGVWELELAGLQRGVVDVEWKAVAAGGVGGAGPEKSGAIA